MRPLGFALLLLLGFSSGLAAQTNPVSPAATRLAYFSAARAFAESSEGKTAQAALASLRTTKTKEIDARTAKLQAMRQAAAAPDAASNGISEREIERFELDLRRFTEDAQAEFLGVQKAAESAFLTKLRPIFDSVVKEKQLLVVFDIDSGLLAWADPSLDITPDIVKRLDQPK
ncbi:MAG TPA: OmpH family outer membrane protein [Vicinamibacterales bacterium]|nr:OmpH family outer membrane protein [Vicinamibacterales bacterium]